MRIVVDAMGTDKHPHPDIEGALLAAKEFSDTILLVGDEKQIKPILSISDTKNLDIVVIHAEENITMEDKPNLIVRGKPDSSMHIGMKLLKNGEADAFVTAGNTGAALAVAMFQLRRIKGVKRPAITAVGDLMGHLITIADVGANTDTKLDWLKQFALMGDIYAKNVLNIESPRIGLLSNGEEDTKGDQLVREAHVAFQDMSFNFVGNIEPKGLLSGQVDVLITDGYVGNIMLKTYEAAISGVFQLMRQELKQDLRGQIGGTIARPALRRVVNMVDPTQYGGAPLLGVSGVVIITHGGATAPVIRNSIQQARRAVEANLLEKIELGLANLDVSDEE